MEPGSARGSSSGPGARPIPTEATGLIGETPILEQKDRGTVVPRSEVPSMWAGAYSSQLSSIFM
jgi:hypothetical protein